jgi:putative hemolysin
MSTPQLLVTTSQSAGSPHYTLLVAQQQAEVRAAQRIRHRVFAGEMGAVLHSSQSGLDVDEFDAHCDHLVVREDRTGEIVGTYRMLPPDGARHAGGLYGETEFAIPGLTRLREALVETGRSCVHPDHRTGAVVSLVWAGIARYMLLTGYRWLVGCASVPLRTPGASDGTLAAGVWETVRARHLGPSSTGCSRTGRGTSRPRRDPSGPPCPRCCVAACGWAPGCAGRPRTTRTSG